MEEERGGRGRGREGGREGVRGRDGRREKGGREEVATGKEEWKEQERVEGVGEHMSQEGEGNEGGREEEREGEIDEEGEGRKSGVAYLCKIWLQIDSS